MTPDPEGVLRVVVERSSESQQTAYGTIRVIRGDTGGEIYAIDTAAHYGEEGFGQ